MNLMKNLSIKASISLLLIVTVIIFSTIVIIGFNQVSTETANKLHENQKAIETLNIETEETLFEHLYQLNQQVDNGFSLFLAKMKEVLTTIENNENLSLLAGHETLPSGQYVGTPYEILPPLNKQQVNETLTPYFANIVEGIEGIQFAYVGTPDGAMYIGPLDDFDFTNLIRAPDHGTKMQFSNRTNTFGPIRILMQLQKSRL